MKSQLIAEPPKMTLDACYNLKEYCVLQTRNFVKYSNQSQYYLELYLSGNPMMMFTGMIKKRQNLLRQLKLNNSMIAESLINHSTDIKQGYYLTKITSKVLQEMNGNLYKDINTIMPPFYLEDGEIKSAFTGAFYMKIVADLFDDETIYIRNSGKDFVFGHFYNDRFYVPFSLFENSPDYPSQTFKDSDDFHKQWNILKGILGLYYQFDILI